MSATIASSWLGRSRLWLAEKQGWRTALCAALLGALSALALPPLYILPALLIAVPGLLILIGSAPNWRVAAWRGFCFGWGHHLVGLYWITSAIIVEAADYWWLIPFAVPGLALILAPFIALPCAGAKCAPAGGRRVLVLTGLWGLGDLARQFVGTGFPWDPWGTVWALPGALGDIMIQPAAWVSVHGLTMATLLLAATPLLGRRWMVLGGATLMLWAGLGWMRLQMPVSPAPGLSVILAQGNIPQNLKWNHGMAQQVLDHYMDLSAQGLRKAGDKPSVLVWPESSFPGLLADEEAARIDVGSLSGMIGDGHTKPQLANMIGSVRFGSEAAGMARPYNSLIAFTPDGRIRAIYDKWHLVPFGEYAPTWLPFAVKLVPGGGFIRGSGPHTLHLPGVPPVGPIICYEAIFPAQVIDESDRPDWIVNITNDAWFGNSAGPRQHWEAARLRAVEEGLPVLRAANTGISGGFDAFGHVIGALGLNQTGELNIFIPGHLPPTLFARLGLLLPLVLAIALAVTGWLLKLQIGKR